MMTKIRVGLVLILLGSLVLFTVQNLSPSVPLVFLSGQTAALPLALWLLLAIALGALTSGVLALTQHRPSPAARSRRGFYQPPPTSPRDRTPPPRDSARPDPAVASPRDRRSTTAATTATTSHRADPDWGDRQRQWDDWSDWGLVETGASSARATPTDRARVVPDWQTEPQGVDRGRIPDDEFTYAARATPPDSYRPRPTAAVDGDEYDDDDSYDDGYDDQYDGYDDEGYEDEVIDRYDEEEVNADAGPDGDDAVSDRDRWSPDWVEADPDADPSATVYDADYRVLTPPHSTDADLSSTKAPYPDDDAIASGTGPRPEAEPRIDYVSPRYRDRRYEPTAPGDRADEPDLPADPGTEADWEDWEAFVQRSREQRPEWPET